MPKFNINKSVTQDTRELIESKGVTPWNVPYKATCLAFHQNALSGRPYKIGNALILTMQSFKQGYSDPRWVTNKQAFSLGVDFKGQKTTKIWGAGPMERELEDGTKETVIRGRLYSLFNVEQCKGIEDHIDPLALPDNFEPIKIAEGVLDGFKNPPEVSYGPAFSPCYIPKLDKIELPPKTAFHNEELFYSTIYHELAHSTGHSSRLDRGLENTTRHFGDTAYSEEELVAELTALTLCRYSGLEKPVDNSKNYLSGWAKAIKNDEKMILRAASRADKAVKYILGEGVKNERS
jgi:antirestriction protein ArdC